MNFFGINITPYETENLFVTLQWQRGFEIFTNPPDGFVTKVDPGFLQNPPQTTGSFINVTTPVTTNLGDIDWLGGLVMGKIKDLGPGDLHLFGAAALSKTHPNGNLFSLPFALVDINGDGIPDQVLNGGFGLGFNDDPTTPGVDEESHTGHMFYVGGRYDIKPTRTKIGLEFNYGSGNWIGFVPAGDDIWTSKLGARGKVYEIYAIQELFNIPISKRGLAFFRLGWQYYDFDYTGSGNWVGQSFKIGDLSANDVTKTQLFAPLKHAWDLYFSFDVRF